MPSPHRLTWPLRLLICLCVVGLQFVYPAAASAQGQESFTAFQTRVIWTPDNLSTSLEPGASTSTFVSFLSTKEFSRVSVRASGEIAQFVRLSQSLFDKSEAYRKTSLRVSIAAGTTPGVYSGFLQVYSNGVPVPGTFKITLTIPGAIGDTSVNPDSTPAGVPLTATVASSITDPSLDPDSVNLERLGADGQAVTILGVLHDDGLNGDASAGDKIYSISTTILENEPGVVRLRVSASIRGSQQRAYSALLTVNITGTATSIAILSPPNAAYLNTSPVTVRGTAGDPAARVSINGVAAPVSGGSFVATVPLNEGPNTLTAAATNSNGTTSTASTLVTLDTTPPRVEIYSPANNSVTTEATTTVTGLVNDIVVGTVNPLQATVAVNGVTAQVLNRTFTATDIPLAMGANTIQARGIDRAGNSATATITVTRQAATQAVLRIHSGNGQSGAIRSLLPSPLIARLLNGAGQPIPNTPVIFRVINQDGTLSPNGAPDTGLSSIAVNTDAQGLAPVRLFLGSRAGAGNNLVEASATGVASTAVFSSSATPATAGLIIVDNGNNQSGVIGQQLPLPFIAVVTDTGFNRLGGVQVIFTVKSGGGHFGGQPTFTATTDADGRVMASLTLGPNPGVSNNLVEASFSGNNGFPATFTASGLAPGPVSATRITGVVLDNSNNPLRGVTMRLFQVNQGNNGNTPQQVATPVQTNAEGQFTMQPVPVGVFKLMADGGTAQRPGNWPTLEYDIITVAGQNNTVGSPIFLPELLSNNRLCVSPTTGGTLTIPQAPGFSLTVAAGSAIFPGGSRTGCISVTPVNMDKVPMVPGFGQQPRFVVTIQPVGTVFTTPAAITIPNVDGLAPRAVTEMYSFDHDLASFVVIGTGTVSEDGSVIRSDPGVGVLKAGWHCGGNPNQQGSAASLSVSFTPNSLMTAVTKDFSVTANGTPPLDGEYVRWTSGDPMIAAFVTTPACADQPSCTATLKGKKPGTTTIRVTFRCKTTGQSVTTSMSVMVMIPTGETTASGGWGTGDLETVHLWNQTLQPTKVDFSGIQVTERDPGGGADNCYFNGSAIASATSISGGTWPVRAKNLWGADFVGWTTGGVIYYRAQNRVPCNGPIPQAMDVITPNGNLHYRTNILDYTIGITTVSSTRDGHTATKSWP